MNNFENFSSICKQWEKEIKQREPVIKALIADDMQQIENNKLLLSNILREGFTGYKHWPDPALFDEIKTRGLTS